MSDEFAALLARYARVVVRVGLNLAPGQRVLIADPYDLQGITRDSAPLVEAIAHAAREAGAAGVDVIWGDVETWRAAARRWPDAEFESGVRANAARMDRRVRQGDALLFLSASFPGLVDDLPAPRVASLRQRCWELFGPIAQRLVAGATNWTVAPAPIAGWADAVFPDVAAGERLARLWEHVFAVCRATMADPVGAWTQRLARLSAERDALNARRFERVHLRGPGTDLRLALPRGHRWATGSLVRKSDGRRFLANLPTEELFTAPERASADGRVTVARPISYGGAIIDGVTLEFERGRVVRAAARRGEDLLHRLLAADTGAARLGEIAVVTRAASATVSAHRHFFQPLLDENAGNHIALGEAYGFTHERADSPALNHSVLHVDLPIDAADDDIAALLRAPEENDEHHLSR